MDVSAGVLKLDRVIKSKRSLEIKLEKDKDNKVIKDTIEKYKETISFIKKALKFNERFEVASDDAKLCTCDNVKEDDKAANVPQSGDNYGDGVVEGVFVKIKLLKKDGSVGNQTRYVLLED